MASQTVGADASSKDLSDYRLSWMTVNALLRRGNSWSGNERHCSYLNTGQGPMINVSSISGLDFKEDGSGLAVTDWDHDGDVDLWVTNRTAPAVRVLRNQAARSQHFLSLQLIDTRSNRDAIGARVTLLGRSPISMQTLRAGDAFISQSSKTLHFGLGSNATLFGVEIRWPDGTRETIEDLNADCHYQIT